MLGVRDPAVPERDALTEREVSRHVTRSAADARMKREIEKLGVSGRSSGWQRRKFMVRETGNWLRRYKVMEL